jgi:Na+/citrate or Na+/malate symporter
MTVRMKGNLGKLTGNGEIIRKEDKERTNSTKKAEGNLKAKKQSNSN